MTTEWVIIMLENKLDVVSKKLTLTTTGIHPRIHGTTNQDQMIPSTNKGLNSISTSNPPGYVLTHSQVEILLCKDFTRNSVQYRWKISYYQVCTN